MMTTLEKNLTAAEKEAWIESQRKKYEEMHAGEFDFIEFIDGEIIVRVVPDGAVVPEGVTVLSKDGMSDTAASHQQVCLMLSIYLGAFIVANKLGRFFPSPMDLVLEGKIYQPDAFFVASKNAEAIEETKVAGKADLAIEVLSKNSVRRDRIVKLRAYQKAGIDSYWIIDAVSRTIEIHRLNKNHYEVRSRL